jgi:hypothetical protein
MTEEQKQGLTRREVLKKGAMLGGTVLWVVPVVQAVGMSPAMAQVPSEGTCCLRVDIKEVEVTDNDVDVTIRGTNCGSESISNVHLSLEYSQDGGDFGNESSVSSGGLDSGQYIESTVGISNLDPGSYSFRLSGTYSCSGNDNLPHNVPTGYATAGPVVISS